MLEREYRYPDYADIFKIYICQDSITRSFSEHNKQLRIAP